MTDNFKLGDRVRCLCRVTTWRKVDYYSTGALKLHPTNGLPAGSKGVVDQIGSVFVEVHFDREDLCSIIEKDNLELTTTQRLVNEVLYVD